MSASSDIKILKSDYVFFRKGVNIQHVSESRSMVWYRDGYTKLRLKFLNTMYEDYGESLEFSLTIRIARTSDSTNPVFENTYEESFYDPHTPVIETWYDLRACNVPGSYIVSFYDGHQCICSDTIHILEMPQPYVSGALFNTLFLHRVDKGQEIDYKDLGPQYGTFDIDNLDMVLMGVSYELKKDICSHSSDLRFPLTLDVYNEQGYSVWHECQDVEPYDIEGNKFICAFYEIGGRESLKWNQGTYRAEVRFFDEVVNVCTFHIGTRNIEYQYTKVELTPRLSVAGKKHLQAGDAMDSMGKLNQLIGLDSVKKKIEEYRSVVMLSKKRAMMGLPTVRPVLHAAFMGNPGTGKTTVAKILGSMMKELGLLSSGHVVVEERSTLMGQNYASEQEKTLSALERAKGGILFIDEAYLLYKPDDPRDPGINVIETLLTALADPQQQDWMLLIAGYTEPMTRLLEQNAGLKSRIPEQNRFRFDDYTVEELMQIADLFCTQNGYELSDEARAKVRERVEREYGMRDNKFGNARFINNLFKIEVVPAFSMRVNKIDAPNEKDLTLIKAEDISTRIVAEKFDDRFDMEGVHRALAKLDSMVGLMHVKEMIHGMVDTAVWLRDAGKPYFSRKSLKWTFAGNTGTGKSTVASVLGEILKSMNALERGHLVELNGAELAGLPEYRQEEVIKETVNKALEGVLFFDGDDSDGSNGRDIDASSLKLKIESKISDLRGRCALVVGVCKENMCTIDSLMLPADSPYHLMFDDYDAEELLMIVRKILQKNSLVIDEQAAGHLSVYIDAMKKANTYGLASARTMKYISNMIQDKYLFRMSQSKGAHNGVVILDDVDEFIWKETRRKNIGF